MMHFFREKSLCRTRTPIRVPNQEDFDSYCGGHTHEKWGRLSHDWRCPSCKRSKFEQRRWTKSISGFGVPKGEYQWLAPIHEHHDDGADGGERPPRFPRTMLCYDCNNADGRTKCLLELPEDFSFSPEELSMFVTGIHHCGVDIDVDAAEKLACLELTLRRTGLYVGNKRPGLLS
jgi:hypothetical protein